MEPLDYKSLRDIFPMWTQIFLAFLRRCWTPAMHDLQSMMKYNSESASDASARHEMLSSLQAVDHETETKLR
jgi:hypothetical protein